MPQRITKEFLSKRLVTTTSVMREANMLGATESLVYESTGSDRLPWSLVVLTVDADKSRHITATLTQNATWQGLCVAVDAVYELAWHARARLTSAS